MPTLNLGRVRFNWKGAYDPLTSYLEYDCVEDDGQSYVCIAPVTGTGPNETGGGTYWASMLVRSADYNQARQDAIDAAAAADASAADAGNSATAASGSASNASTSEGLSQQWASEAEDVEVAGGEYSAKHYANKAAAFGDPNQFDITADQTADTRTSAKWMAAVLAAQQKANDNETAATNNASAIGSNTDAISANAGAIASLSAVTATAFVKAGGSQAAWTAPTTTTLETASDLALVVGSIIVEIAAGTAVTLPALSAGTDYTIYASDAGALQAMDADSSAPAGERAVGGFHASAGASEIVTLSLWDLNWRPKSNPRGMTLDPGGSVWGDIYLTDVEYTNFGYSRNGQTIADDGNRPILPATVGGDGTAVCPSASWWQFLDIFMAAGKRYAIYEELVSLAYGVVERQAVGTDPGTTQHQAGHRSACGCEQITGVMWQWFSGASATAGSGWVSIAEGRGDVYASNLKAPRFGATWNDGSNAGSRASSWSSAPDLSSSSVGARAVSDHLNLQAER
ncbi:MAG: hypothetical protein CME72_12355 [Halomonadaceae bacterium]|nr:hypothetical protein [Halomonadaceae bacterium]